MPDSATPAPADVDAASDKIAALLDDARRGRRAAIARLLSLVERGGDEARTVGRLCHPLGGHAHTIGITGAPGAGKSTLTNALCTARVAPAEDAAVAEDAAAAAEAAEPPGGVDRSRLAVLAIDPSSPFTGGAILGDRIRMADQVLEEAIYIRSMATRGHLGGLSLATPSAVRVLDAVGFPTVIVETVGVGQVEVEIVGSADTCVVVLNPGWGDAIQANKAGLMEIADIFVINKADRAGAGDTLADVEQMLNMRHDDGWRPPVVSTVASTGQGIAELWDAIDAHHRWLETSGQGAVRRERRTRTELQRIIAAQLAQRAAALGAGERFENAAESVLHRALDPWTAAEGLLDAEGVR